MPFTAAFMPEAFRASEESTFNVNANVQTPPQVLASGGGRQYGSSPIWAAGPSGTLFDKQGVGFGTGRFQ